MRFFLFSAPIIVILQRPKERVSKLAKSALQREDTRQ